MERFKTSTKTVVNALRIPQSTATLPRRSLYLFTQENSFRKKCHAIVSSWIFEYFILAAIITSCVVVKNSRSEVGYDVTNAYAVVDILMNIIFAIEALLKIVTYGFCMHRGSYLRNMWNVVDFVILVGGAISDIVLMFSSADKSVSIKVLRLFRVLRPLRLIVRYDSLKIVLDTIVTSFKTLVHVFSLLLLIIVVYAIVGIELYKGTFRTLCVDESGEISQPVTLCNLEVAEDTCKFLANSRCETNVRDPVATVSFDNIGNALLTVLQIVTMEDWIFIAYKLSSVRNSFVTYAYMVTLVFIGGYFAVGLLMGVLGNKFLKVKMFLSRQKMLAKRRKSEAKDNKDDTTLPIEDSTRPKLSIVTKLFAFRDILKKKCSIVIQGKVFFWVSIGINFFDLIFTSIYAHLPNGLEEKFYFLVIKILIAISFTIEISIVLLGRGIKSSRKHGTFLFDLFVWLITIIEFIVFAITQGSYVYVGLSSVRGISLIRIFRFTSVWPQLSSLIKSFFKSVKGTFGLMILLVIFLSIYALLGNQLFSTISEKKDIFSNFNSFGSSFMMTFVLLTGDGWKGFIDDAITNHNTTLAIIYFISFILLGNFILVNLFLGIIVDTLVGDYEENMVMEGTSLPTNTYKLNNKNVERLKRLHQANETGGGLKNKLKGTIKDFKGKMVAKRDKVDDIFDSNANISLYNDKSIASDFVEDSTCSHQCKTCAAGLVCDRVAHGTQRVVEIKIETAVKSSFIDLHDFRGPHRKIKANKSVDNTASNFDHYATSPVRNFSDGDLHQNNRSQHRKSQMLHCNPSVMEGILKCQSSSNIGKTHNYYLDALGALKKTKPNQQRTYDRPRSPLLQNYSIEINDTLTSAEVKLNSNTEEHILQRKFRALSVVLDVNIDHPIPQHKSLYLFNPNNWFRLKVYQLVTSSFCTIVIWLAIATSSLLLAFQDPFKKDKILERNFDIVDHAFTLVFLVEIILKAIAYGLVLGHKKCYLRDPMNVVDTIVVVIAIFRFFLGLAGIDFVTFRMMRAVRVVRILKLSNDLKEVINCLFNSIQKICHFLLLYLLINYAYALVGVQLYKGQIGTCSNDSFYDKYICGSYGYTWNSAQLSFDNAYEGMVSLFVIGSTDDWFGFLQSILDNPGNSSLMAKAFIITFIIIMSFLLLQILTGFIIVGYHAEKEKEERFEVFDKSSQEYILAAFGERPSKASTWERNYLREKIWVLVSSMPFQVLSLAFICLNTIILATQQHNEPLWLIQLQRYCNIIFTVIFTIEIILKCVAVTFREFFTDAWLLFDTLVIIGSWVDVILNEMEVIFLNMSLFRMFRVARLMKFIGKGGNLRQLFLTFIKSLKSVPSIAVLLGLVIYLYAILGMELFGCMQLDLTPKINKDANFRTFGAAVLVLVRITTLDAWQDIMLAVGHRSAHTCDMTPSKNQPYYSYFYFSSFVLVCSFWITNLFLAVIMDNFVYLTHDISTLTLRHIQDFTQHWGKYDRLGVGYITAEDLVNLLKRLDPPIGKGMFCPSHLLYGKLMKLKIPVEPNMVVKFDDVLLSLVIDALNLQSPRELIRHELHLLIPKLSEEKLDRVLPLFDEPKEFNAAEKKFYENCASYVITGHFKIYAKGLQKRKSCTPTKNHYSFFEMSRM